MSFRSHRLVLGATGTGKGVITAAAARAAKRAGVPTFLLANKKDEYDSFPADWKTMSQARFLEAVMNWSGKTGLMAVIDEAWAWDWKTRETGLQAIPNAGRSLGVELWVQSQFPTQMPPTVRLNCDAIFCFALRGEGATWAAKNYDLDETKILNLKRGEYIFRDGLSNPIKGVAWHIDGNGNYSGVR